MKFSSFLLTLSHFIAANEIKKGHIGCFVRDQIQFSHFLKKCTEVMCLMKSLFLWFPPPPLHPAALQNVCARIGWSWKGLVGQIGHRPITLLAGSESLVLLPLLFLRLSHGNSFEFLLAAKSEGKWFEMYHNKHDYDHHRLCTLHSDFKDPAFQKGNVQDTHNSKVLNIPNNFWGLSSAITWELQYRVLYANRNGASTVS